MDWVTVVSKLEESLISIATLTVYILLTGKILEAKIKTFVSENNAEHSKIFSLIKKVTIPITYYSENKALYVKLEESCKSAIDYTHNESIQLFASELTREIILFSKEINLIGIDNITSSQIRTKMAIFISHCKNKYEDILGEEHSAEYFEILEKDSDIFADAIEKIAVDFTNGKDDRFRSDILGFTLKNLRNLSVFFNNNTGRC